MSKQAATAATALVFLCPVGAFTSQDPLGTVRAALVTVLAYDAEGKELRKGAGFFASEDGHLITARDVLRGASRAEARTEGNTTYAVKGVVSESVSAGIVRAVIELPEGGVEFAEVSAEEPKVREPVVVVGTGGEGVISSVRDVPALGKVIRMTAPVPPHASGAPVVDSKGRVIGVAMWQASDPKDTSFAFFGESVTALTPGPLRSFATFGWRPTGAEADYREGLNRLFLDDYEGALARFEQALEKDPQYPEAWFHAGFAKGKLGDTKAKIEAYREAVRLKPDYAGARYSLAVSYVLMGEGELALEEYKTLKTLDPELAAKLEILLEALIHVEHEEPEIHAPAEPAQPGGFR